MQGGTTVSTCTILLLLVVLDSGAMSMLWEGTCGNQHEGACSREGLDGWEPAGDWQADMSAWYSDVMAALELVNRQGWEAVRCTRPLS